MHIVLKERYTFGAILMVAGVVVTWQTAGWVAAIGVALLAGGLALWCVTATRELIARHHDDEHRRGR